MANQCFVIAQIALVVKKEKPKYNKQTKKNQGKKIKNGNNST